MSTRDRITLDRLVRILDSSTSTSSQHYLSHLKLQATARHARELLASIRADEAVHDVQSWPSTRRALFRQTAAPRGSLADLESRIASAERYLADSWETVSASSRPAAPVGSSADLDWLLPAVPPPMPIPLPPAPPSPPRTRPASPSVSSDSASSPLHDPAANDADVVLPSSPSRPTALPPVSSGMRQRAPPPWANKKGKSPAVTAEDLLPADSSPSGTDLLSHHHALQSSLLSDLTTLSSTLKTSSLAFSSNLEKDREVLEKAQEKLERNSGRMNAEQARLKQVRGKTRGTTCWTIGILAVVAALWVLVFLLIKVT
ncbi:hypothetical protein JCM1841_004044 [Sporobolomyces salmonicolor]